MLILALILGFVPSIAPVNAAAETGEILVISCTSSVRSYTTNLLTTNNKTLGDYAGVELAMTGANGTNPTLTSDDWSYLRQIFTAQTNLKSLTMANSSFTKIPEVTSSDTYSPQWESVTLPTILTSIGNNAFRKSTKLTSIFIPQTVTGIGTLAFAGCTSLEAINIASENTTFKNFSGDGVVYSNSSKNLHTFPAGKKAADGSLEYTIPPGIQTLGIGSFADVKLTKLTIPTGVTAVNCAFVRTPDSSGYSSGYSLFDIYFNAATPPAMTTSGRSSYESNLKYNEITIYVPSPSVKTYENNSSYNNGKFKKIDKNIGNDAEILGIKINGTVGIGPYAGSDVSTFSEEDEEDEEDDTAFYTGHAHLNLSDESLDITINVGTTIKPFVVKGYSTNGGSTWVAGELTTAKLTSALNTASQIKLSNSFDSSTKKPKVDSDIITFPNVQARPTGNPYSYKVFYKDDYWGLVKTYTDTAFVASITSYKYVIGENGKLPTSPVWNTNITSTGIKIDDYPAKGVKKNVYFLRLDAFEIPATETADAKYYPNSKTWKVTPATKSKAPTYKVDYKKEIIKLKKGDSLDGEYGTAKVNVSVTELLNDDVRSVEITKLATGKKPGSMTQTLELAARGNLDNSSFNVDKGRIKDKSLKLYEFSANGTTWGRMPKASSTQTLYIRLKQNVKVKKGVIEGNAASDPGRITLKWDVYDDVKNKSGIVDATYAASPVADNAPVEPDDPDDENDN